MRKLSAGFAMVALASLGLVQGYSPAGCNITQCMTVQSNNTATQDPAARVTISQYDPIFASPVGNFTPWQIHISPADDAFENMYVVYATGQYITGPNDDGGLCGNSTSTRTARAPESPNDINAVQTNVQWSYGRRLERRADSSWVQTGVQSEAHAVTVERRSWFSPSKSSVCVC